MPEAYPRAVLYQLAYMSTTSEPWPRDALLRLLRQARANNRRHDLTGVLLFRNGGFVQLIEGERPAVENLFGKIRADRRHENVTSIWDTESRTRWFAEWSMGFRDLERDPVTEPGLTDVLRGSVDASLFSHEVVIQLWKLLRRTGPT